MVSLKLKRVTRHAECGHLIPEGRNVCPYCSGEFEFKPSDPQIEEINDGELESSSFEVSAEAKKKVGIVAGIIVLIAIGFFGWQKYMDSQIFEKSITEELNEKQIESASKKYADFSDFYQTASSLREFISSLPNKQEFEKITYHQMYDFINNHYNNEIYISELKKTAIDGYESTIRQPIMPKVNELTEKWKDYIMKHDPSQYIEVTVNTGYYCEPYYNNYHPSFWFTTTYDSNKVSDCLVSYSIEALDIHHTINLSELQTLNSSDKSRYFTYLYSNYRDFWDKCSMTAKVLNVTLTDGTVVSGGSLDEVPSEVRFYLHNPEENSEYAMIKALIDENYPSKAEYCKQEINHKLRNIDSACFDLLELYSEYNQSFPLYRSDLE
ncbi:MAG: hypothetical protein HUK12_08110 [Muribaculaceae bacterium]|nr:hypothetical protein [Muribaculaceae bacterium]